MTTNIDLNNVPTLGAVGAANATAATEPAALAVASVAKNGTPLERVTRFLTSSHVGLDTFLSYPAEDSEEDGAGCAVLTIPSSAVHGSSSGQFLVKLVFPERVDGVLMVKTSLSYIPDGAGGIETLARGAGDDADKSRWRNITSNKVPLGALLAAGYFDENACQAVVNWALTGTGQLKLDLPKGSAFKVVLRANIQVDPLKAKYSSRVVTKKVEVGEDANLGMDGFVFDGATVVALVSSLLRQPAAGVAVALTEQELVERYLGGVQAAKWGALGEAPVATPDPAAEVAEAVYY
jgi:hypothetical protein